MTRELKKGEQFAKEEGGWADWCSILTRKDSTGLFTMSITI